MRRPAATVSHAPSTPATGQDRYYVADLRFMTATEQEALVHNFSITALDTFLTVDRAAPKGDFQALAVKRIEPSWLESYWVSSTYALRRVVPSPFLTWELRDRFDLSPNDPPTIAPVSFEDMRIQHNIAVARGDAADAARWLAALLAGCDLTARHTFADGDQLLGSRLERGTSLVYSVYFLAAAPDESEPALVMHSIIEAAPASSLVNKDSAVADVGVPFAIPASRWKRGYVYVSLTEIIRRIGRERWYGSFLSARDNSAAAFPMLTLE